MKRHNVWLTIVTSIYLLGFSSSYAAPQPQKRQENLPVEITADSLIAKDKAGISIYKGNVIIIQGTTTIKGDIVTLHHPARQISSAVAVGKPATFKRYLPEEKGWVNGKADKITYSASNRTLLLEGHAEIVQKGQNSITGPQILYNLQNKTLSAKGGKKQRIKMIFTPEKQDKP